MISLRKISKFVIESPDRRASIIGNQLRNGRQLYNSVPGTFLTKFPDEFVAERSWIKCRRYLSLPEVGCAASHLECYRRFLESDEQIALIFEDDARVINMELLDEILQHIISLDLSKRICVSFYTTFATLKRGLRSDGYLYSVVDVPNLTVCYVITREAAKALLEANSNFDYNADWPKNTKIDFYLSKAAVVITGDGPSLIAENRGSVNISRMQRFSIMISIFCGLHYLNYKKSFGGLADYIGIMIKPTFMRTFYRFFSTSLEGFSQNVRISIWR